MFTAISQLKYYEERDGEHLWIMSGAGEAKGEPTMYVAATLLDGSITRVRCVRVAASQQLDARRYYLADGGEGTLPYHSWMVAKGDEQWSRMADAGGVSVRIDEDYKGYQPQRDGYELVVHIGNRMFQRSIKAGQGGVTVHLG